METAHLRTCVNATTITLETTAAKVDSLTKKKNCFIYYSLACGVDYCNSEGTCDSPGECTCFNSRLDQLKNCSSC
jgi:hypothetical protein